MADKHPKYINKKMVKESKNLEISKFENNCDDIKLDRQEKVLKHYRQVSVNKSKTQKTKKTKSLRKSIEKYKK